MYDLYSTIIKIYLICEKAWKKKQSDYTLNCFKHTPPFSTHTPIPKPQGRNHINFNLTENIYTYKAYLHCLISFLCL